MRLLFTLVWFSTSIGCFGGINRAQKLLNYVSLIPTQFFVVMSKTAQLVPGDKTEVNKKTSEDAGLMGLGSRELSIEQARNSYIEWI